MFATLSSDPHVNLLDVDIPLNINDEPALLVPWETIDTALSMSRKIMLELSNVVSTFSGLADIEILTENYDWEPEWLGLGLNYPASHLGARPLWSLVRPACPPHSPARVEQVYSDIWDPRVTTKEEHEAIALLPSDIPEGSLKRSLSRWTHTTDACQRPHLQGLHSAFVRPKNMAVATKLFPLFGDAKFGVSNEILIPGVEEWNMSLSPAMGVVGWDQREDKLH